MTRQQERLMENLAANAHVQRVKLTLVQHAVLLGSIVFMLWLIEGVDRLWLGGGLDYYGIRPRTMIGLRNIVLSPFLHAGFGHLLANTLPFLLLGWFVMLRSTREFFLVTLIVTVVSGVGVWLFGAGNSVHIGISGVIFGYLGYLLFRGYLERSVVGIALALLAIFFYGGMIFGVLPFQAGISWLGHLFGFLGGILAARILLQQNGHRRDTEGVSQGWSGP